MTVSSLLPVISHQLGHPSFIVDMLIEQRPVRVEAIGLYRQNFLTIYSLKTTLQTKSFMEISLPAFKNELLLSCIMSGEQEVRKRQRLRET